MADLAQLEAALVKADAAGDVEGARVLASEVRRVRSTKPAEARGGLPKIIDYHPGLGLGEAALTLGTGAAGAVAGGFSGLGTIATNALGLTNTPPEERVRQVSEALTYEPRTKAGQAISEKVALPFEMLAKGADIAGGKVTDVIGSPVAGTAVNTAIQSLPMLISPAARAIPGESAAAIAARAKVKALDAPRAEQIAAARQAGLKLTPQEAGSGPISRTAASIAGEPRLAKLASNKNAEVINGLIRRDLGLPEDVPLSRQTLSDIRKESGQSYEAVKNTGTVELDAKFKADLYESNKSVNVAAKELEHRADSSFKKVHDSLAGKERLNAETIVEEVKNLRGDADAAYTRGEKQLGAAYKKAAQALDDQLERHLDRSKDPAKILLVKQYKDARTRIAKSYAADKALNDATGNIDAAIYGKELKKGKPLTGAGRQVGEFANAFQRSTQRAERTGATGPTRFDLLVGGIGGLVGGALGGWPGATGLALGAGAPLTRMGLLTEPVQNAMTRPRTYGPPRIRRLQDLLSEIGDEAALAGVSSGQGNRR